MDTDEKLARLKAAGCGGKADGYRRNNGREGVRPAGLEMHPQSG
jgi:hypothetical protein